jgi:hypothetical protein
MSETGTPKSKTRTALTWGLTGLVGVGMIGSAAGKLSGAQPLVENFEKMHLSAYLQPIGILELVVAVLFLVPKTSSLGTLLVTGYFGGAVVAHLAGASPGEIVAPLVIGAMAWASGALRNPGTFESFRR